MNYKVKKGDTLSKIAKEHNMSLEELLKLNGISGDKANHILVGQNIKVKQGVPYQSFGTSVSFVPQGMYSFPPKTTDKKSTEQPTKETGDKSQSSTAYWNPMKAFSNTEVKSNDSAGVPYRAEYTISEYAKNNASAIQQQLVEEGYSVGSSGVDGKWGKDSQAALDKALSEGYTFKNGQLVKQKFKTPKLVSKNSLKDPQYLKKNATVIQTLLAQEGFDIGKSGIDGKWGTDSQKALDQAIASGYVLQNGALVNPKMKVAQPAKQGLWNSFKNAVSNEVYDNMYPYNYGDVQNPDGSYRQVNSSDSAQVQIKAGLQKMITGTKEIDPRRALMNELVSVDLNTKEGLAKWKELVKQADGLDLKMVRYKGSTLDQIKNQQWEMRARLDAMNLYQGRPQQWDTYIEQNDESKRSGRATKAGKPTLIIRDIGQRNRINGELLNYWEQHPEQRVKGDNGLFRMPVMSYLGNASIVQQEDGSLRYADDWDYTWTSKDDPNRPYFGEVLSDFSGKNYGTGVNGRSFDEGFNLKTLVKNTTDGITGKLLAKIS